MSEKEFELYLSLLSRFLRLKPDQRAGIADELRDHLEERLEELTRSGLSREDAVHQALEEFGDASELAAHFTNLARRRKRRTIMRWTFGTAGTISAALVAAVFLWNPNPAAQGPRPANAQGKKIAGDPGLPNAAHQFVGSIEPSRQVALYARIAGYVNKVHAGVGDRVKKGQVLAELLAPELHADLQQKKAVVAQAKAELEAARLSSVISKAAYKTSEATVAQAQAEVDGAKANVQSGMVKLKYVEQLAKQKAVSHYEVEPERLRLAATQAAMKSAEAKLQAAKADVTVNKSRIARSEAIIKSAQARVQVAEADVDRAATLVSYTKIRAPWDGVVSRRSAVPGAFALPPSAGNAEPLFVLIDTSRVRVFFHLPESLADAVHKGTSVIVDVPVRKKNRIHAKVTRVSPTVDSRTGSLRVEIEIPNPPASNLRPGMAVNVVLPGHEPVKKAPNGKKPGTRP